MGFCRIDEKVFFLKRLIVLLLFLIVTQPAFSNNKYVELGDTILASTLNLRAIELAQAKNYIDAIATFQKAAVEYKAVDAWDRFFYTQHSIGYLLNAQNKYSESFNYLDSIDRAYSSELSSQFESYQRFYGVLAWSQFRQFNYDKAFYYFNLVDLGAKENPNVKPEQILFSKYYQGVIYQRIGQYDKALELMLLNIDLGDKASITTYRSMSYNNLGIIYRNMGEYERALEFYKKALVEEKKLKPEIQLTPIYNNLGKIYYYLKEYPAALKELNYGIKVLTDFTSDYYGIESALINSKALVLIELDSLGEAKGILEKNLSREFEKYKEYGPYSTSTIKGLGALYSRLNNYDEANTYYDQSIEITLKYLGPNTDKLAEDYNFKATNLLKTKKYNEALIAIQNGIISLVTEFSDNDFKSNPSLSLTILNKVVLIESLYLKSKVLLAIFSNTDEIEYLQAADEANQLTQKLVELVRKNMLYESSKMNLSNRAKSIYEQTIQIALLLEKESGISATVRVFDAMEKSKAYLLSESIEKAKALGYSNLPQAILQKEDSFRTKLKVLEAQRSNNLLRSKDTTQLAVINQELFEIKEEFEKYRQSQKTVAATSQVNLLDFDSFQSSISSDELIVEYFAGKEELYALAISETDVVVYQLGRYSEQINNFVKSIRNVQAIESDIYQSQAIDVYKLLLEPVLVDHNGVKSLVIIPDKQLGYIPFDALVSKEVKSPKYNTLSYLLNDYILLQHQTVALYIDPLNHDGDISNNFIGFAPDFNEEDLITATNNQLRNDLQPLPFAKKEVISITKLLNGEEETGVNASESNLKARASSFNILHLATHAIIDEDNPLYSKLLFNNGDSLIGDDGELHSFEIFGMNLNASLVTLSACNTGTGKYLEGEGIFSLGRSFLMAGAKSVLTSLWEVSDLSTSEIMESFYANLKKGEESPKALRLAKLKYLNNADPLTANPHYWAAFVYIGQSSKIYSSNKYYWFAGIGILFLGLSIGVIRMRKSS